MGIGCGPVITVYLSETRPARLAPRDLSRSSSPLVVYKPFFVPVDWRSPPLACRHPLTFVNASPVLLMEVMGFSRGDYAITMALTGRRQYGRLFFHPFFALAICHKILILSQAVFDLRK